MKQEEIDYNYEVSVHGNELAQWKRLEGLSKEDLQAIAGYVIKEIKKSKREGALLLFMTAKAIHTGGILTIDELKEYCDKIIKENK